ncbi:MAG: 2-dehydropantoate 2-reductase [Clostridium sp.]|jgi:2-dehydropantoate 2-reductase
MEIKTVSIIGLGALGILFGNHLSKRIPKGNLKILGTLSPKGKPSMRQDMEARRYSEVELFAGEVLKLGKKYGISTPVNRKLYDRIKFIEGKY